MRTHGHTCIQNMSSPVETTNPATVSKEDSPPAEAVPTSEENPPAEAEKSPPSKVAKAPPAEASPEEEEEMLVEAQKAQKPTTPRGKFPKKAKSPVKTGTPTKTLNFEEDPSEKEEEEKKARWAADFKKQARIDALKVARAEMKAEAERLKQESSGDDETEDENREKKNKKQKNKIPLKTDEQKLQEKKEREMKWRAEQGALLDPKYKAVLRRPEGTKEKFPFLKPVWAAGKKITKWTKAAALEWVRWTFMNVFSLLMVEGTKTVGADTLFKVVHLMATTVANTMDKTLECDTNDVKVAIQSGMSHAVIKHRYGLLGYQDDCTPEQKMAFATACQSYEGCEKPWGAHMATAHLPAVLPVTLNFPEVIRSEWPGTVEGWATMCGLIKENMSKWSPTHGTTRPQQTTKDTKDTKEKPGKPKTRGECFNYRDGNCSRPKCKFVHSLAALSGPKRKHGDRNEDQAEPLAKAQNTGKPRYDENPRVATGNRGGRGAGAGEDWRRAEAGANWRGAGAGADRRGAEAGAGGWRGSETGADRGEMQRHISKLEKQVEFNKAKDTIRRLTQEKDHHRHGRR
jgi:chemotaxis protein histidine kinase CheA